MNRLDSVTFLMVGLVLLTSCEGAVAEDELTATSQRYCEYKSACDESVTWCDEYGFCHPYDSIPECTAGVEDEATMWEVLTPYCRDAYIKKLTNLSAVRCAGFGMRCSVGYLVIRMRGRRAALCAKCDGRMEIGTIASYNAPYRNSIRLIKGTPKAGFFGRGYVKVQDHEYPLLAYVCLGCGYTEFYSELSRPF